MYFVYKGLLSYMHQQLFCAEYIAWQLICIIVRIINKSICSEKYDIWQAYSQVSWWYI